MPGLNNQAYSMNISELAARKVALEQQIEQSAAHHNVLYGRHQEVLDLIKQHESLNPVKTPGNPPVDITPKEDENENNKKKFYKKKQEVCNEEYGL